MAPVNQNTVHENSPPLSPIPYDSPADLCKRVLKRDLPYEPRDYQLDGVCPVLDGFDLLAATPTGSGKTGYLTQLMLMACALAEDPSLQLNDRAFLKDPVMLVVSPTNSLEMDMVITKITRLCCAGSLSHRCAG
ncbi:hypothetical protein HWV62_26620 [Athelia sp. TMB]|nr:hypothetical protein HWV62_26620 [Athelia sp. TMB]